MGRASPADSTRCHLGDPGLRARGSWAPRLPPPWGMVHTAPACGSLGALLPSKHVGTTSLVASQTKEGAHHAPLPPALHQNPQCHLHQAQPCAEPAKSLSQGQGKRHGSHRPCRSHHKQCPLCEDHRAVLGLLKSQPGRVAWLISETASLPPPLDLLTHNLALAVPARQQEADTAKSRPHGTASISPGWILAPHRCRHGSAPPASVPNRGEEAASAPSH